MANVKENLFKLLLFIFGLIFLSIGATLAIHSKLGTGAWDAVSSGLYLVFGLSVGIWINIICFIVLILSSFLTKSVPRLTTLITSILFGLFLDFWLSIVNIIPNNSISLQLIIFLFGIIFSGFGCALYIISELPPSPIDHFMICVKNYFNISIGFAKFLNELFALMLGLILGGPIGIGTLIYTLFIGTIIQFFYKYLNYLF